ncbi:hypothetical protein M569_03634 [Genlisea aurea]|uniref:SAM domain-containing protein n=1 Tax=Genlisea aurea TaxID=192259 RepID=S8EEY7_9LAMI|nr:hypothetical protein M569_03634 [Genlisea aurea]
MTTFFLTMRTVMDWFTWLSRTNLHPSLVREYASVFVENELEEDDVAYFSHEFLLSMGVSTAKHRLEIVKLAAKHRPPSSSSSLRMKPVVWLSFARKYLSRRIRSMVAGCHHHRRPEVGGGAITVVSRRNHSLRWRVSMLQRNRRPRSSGRVCFVEEGAAPPVTMMMLTNGTPVRDGGSSSTSWGGSEAGDDPSTNTWNDEYCWSSKAYEVKWDSMFKNLKPT